MTRLYPAGLRLAGQRCLVAGGGAVAARKVQALLAAGAAVHVVAPDATASLQALVRQGSITWSARPVVADDLTGCRLAIICTDDRAVNHLLAAEAEQRGVPANVADAPEEGNLVSPALVERDELLIAVWSGGGPVVSQLVRDRIAASIGREWGALARVMAGCRAEINRTLPADRRAAFWRWAISEHVLDLLRRGDEAGAAAALRSAGQAYLSRG